MVHSRRGWFAAAVLALACVDLRPLSSDELAAASATAELLIVAADPPPARIDADRFGVGWLERDGVFESYNERVRLRVRPGWIAMPDDFVGNRHPGAGSGLYHSDEDIAIYFIIERHVEQSRQTYGETRRKSALVLFQVTEPEPPMTATFAGTDLVFDAASSPTEDFLHAVHYVEDDALQIVIAHPHTGDRERIRERIRAVLADVELLTPGEVEAIRAELARGPDTQNRVDPTWSLRRGVYRDFTHDLSWTSPGRDWVIITQPLARAFGPGSILMVHNRMERLGARLSVYDDAAVAEADSTTFHEAGVASLQGDPKRVGHPRRLKVGSTEALIQTLALEISGEQTQQVVATIKHGSLGLLWIIGGPVPQVEANAALIDAVILNTHVEAKLVEAGMDGSRFVDQRLGYSLERPSDHRQMMRETFNLKEGIEGTLWGTADGRSAIGVLVHGWAGSGWIKDELLADTKAFWIDLWGPITTERTASLDGEVGEHLHWEHPARRDILIVNRDYTVYMLEGVDADPELFERVRESFEFVD